MEEGAWWASSRRSVPQTTSDSRFSPNCGFQDAAPRLILVHFHMAMCKKNRKQPPRVICSKRELNLLPPAARLKHFSRDGFGLARPKKPRFSLWAVLCLFLVCREPNSTARPPR